MNSNLIASMMSGIANPAMNGTDNVVELGLLLPANRASALMRLAQDRRESVGQLLRKLIERELAETA